jgi:hypothetical protein
MSAARMEARLTLTVTFALLMFAVAICMAWQGASGGGLVYFNNGLAFEPADLGKALQMLAVMLLIPMLAAHLAHARNTWLLKIAVLMCPLALVLFPIPFEARLWSEAFYPDGQPMFDDSHERVKSWDAFFGYAPIWHKVFSVSAPYDRYETTDLGERQELTGNRLWGEHKTYGLNQNGWPGSADDSPGDEVFECVFEDTHYVLGFYWRNRKLEDLRYRTQDKLPAQLCRKIKRPAIGSEVS